MRPGDPRDMLEVAQQLLGERVAAGIGWLTEHDPASVFHAWFMAGITPDDPKPAQDAATVEAYAAYHRQRIRWEHMERELALLEHRAPAVLHPNHWRWLGTQERRR